MEHIYLVRGSILDATGLRSSDDKKEMEWLGLRTPGLYRCLFDDIVTNESGIIKLYDSISTASSSHSNLYDESSKK
jgi:hypothetical protein